MIDPMNVSSGGVAVFFSSYVEESRNADMVSKNKNMTSSQNRLPISTWLQMGTKPVWGTLQLWIFLSGNINTAIDVLTRRVGSRQADHFVVALWICSKFSGGGTGKKYQHDDSLGICTPIHCTSTLFPPTYDMRRLIDGKFRGVSSKIGGFVSI